MRETSYSLPWRSSLASPTAALATARPHPQARACVDLGAESCAALSSSARLGSAAAAQSSRQRRPRHLSRRGAIDSALHGGGCGSGAPTSLPALILLQHEATAVRSPAWRQSRSGPPLLPPLGGGAPGGNGSPSPAPSHLAAPPSPPTRTTNCRAGPLVKELLHSFEYEGIGRALQNEGADKGGRCRAFSLIPVLQEADKGTGAGGLSQSVNACSPLQSSFGKKFHSPAIVRQNTQHSPSCPCMSHTNTQSSSDDKSVSRYASPLPFLNQILDSVILQHY
jgi:hypothetical protein